MGPLLQPLLHGGDRGPYDHVSPHVSPTRPLPGAGFDLTPEGWIRWPEREDLSFEFMRVLAAAADGGATVSECWLTAGRIDFRNDDSWHREWLKIADLNHERGTAALADGRLATARSSFLRAITYYQAAAFPSDLSPDKAQAALAAMRGCALNYLRCRRPRGEVVSIPWLRDFSLQGYFLPANDTGKPAPVVVCIGEPGQRKEEFLAKLAGHAFARGMALLAVDVMGDGTTAEFERMAKRHKLEFAIAAVMDYVCGRDDVDDNRIAVVADGWSSSFVARGIAFDPRVAAAACDGGIWDLHTRALVKHRIGPLGIEACDFDAACPPHHIGCPLLITAGGRGWLKSDRVAELSGRLADGRHDVTLKIFDTSETAAAQGHNDNPTLANEFIFDWIASRLGIEG